MSHCSLTKLSRSETAKMKVHGAVLSTASQRVFACLYEKQLDFELVPVDMSTGGHKMEPFISLNPFGQLPAFEDGDLTLFESRAITSYLSHAYAGKGNQLMYSDAKKMAIASMWIQVEGNQFDPVASSLCWELVFKTMFGMTAAAAVVDEKTAKLGLVLDIYEARLAQSKYLGGHDFTLADLHHLPCIQLLMGTQVKKLFDSRPRVSAWCADILARPAWLKVVAMQASN
ncbi:glutathione S-transferase-like [Rhododendron vialii]|uniref:glutathione S-transferase-like n=1 Tax=Rhododendron vialii TaxID=182163 RepID=UPI00265E32D9|nr:glutathione S-transferase-like [Rhododendron vialii]